MDEILKAANEIFTDKIKSGRYSHYDNLALERLWMDCFAQAREMDISNVYYMKEKTE